MCHWRAIRQGSERSTPVTCDHSDGSVMGAVEKAMEPGVGVALRLLVGVRVDLQCHGQP
jgi:hypothetical protein